MSHAISLHHDAPSQNGEKIRLYRECSTSDIFVFHLVMLKKSYFKNVCERKRGKRKRQGGKEKRGGRDREKQKQRQRQREEGNSTHLYIKSTYPLKILKIKIHKNILTSI